MTIKVLYLTWVALSLPYFVYRLHRSMRKSWAPGKPPLRSQIILALMTVGMALFDWFFYVVISNGRLPSWLEGRLPYSVEDRIGLKIFWASVSFGLLIFSLVVRRKAPPEWRNIFLVCNPFYISAFALLGISSFITNRRWDNVIFLAIGFCFLSAYVTRYWRIRRLKASNPELWQNQN
jgi:hypothetical protein